MTYTEKIIIQNLFSINHSLSHIERRIEKLMANTDALTAAVASVVEDVAVVSQVITDLRAAVATLQEAVNQNAIDQSVLDAATAALTQADAGLDSVTATPST